MPESQDSDRIPDHSDTLRRSTTSGRNPISRIPTTSDEFLSDPIKSDNFSDRIGWHPTVGFLVLTQVKLGTSKPIGSVEFRRFPCDRIPMQISSDEFRSVPMGSVDFQQIPGRNFAEPTGILS